MSPAKKILPPIPKVDIHLPTKPPTAKQFRKRLERLHITREDIYHLVNLSKKGHRLSVAYNLFILLIVVMNICGIYVLMINYYTGIDVLTEERADIILCYITGGLLAMDYILRWISADYKLKLGRKSFLIYPFTPMALIDLLALCPVVLWVGNGLQVLKILRFFVLIHKVHQKKFDLNQYVHGITEIVDIFKKMRIPFISAAVFFIFFVLITSLILISVEPMTFDNNYLNALYWSAISWTGIGYGDITPHSAAGRLITFVGALISVILIALPVSVVTAGITAGYLRQTFNSNGLKVKQDCQNNGDTTKADEDTKTASNEEINFCPICGTKCSPDDNYCKKCGNKLR